MDIREALEKLSGYLDEVAGSGFMTDDELIEMGEVENTICMFVEKYAPKVIDSFPAEYSCNCGTTMPFNRVTKDGEGQYICPGCNAIWYLSLDCI